MTELNPVVTCRGYLGNFEKMMGVGNNLRGAGSNAVTVATSRGSYIDLTFEAYMYGSIHLQNF